MIREFWVENYRSIKDRQTLSFIAKSKESDIVAEIEDGKFLYKFAVLFGANASGKSNLLYALNTIFDILVLPQTNANDIIYSAIPFVLTDSQPIRMFVSFYAASIRYDYEVEFCKQYILRESLYYYPNASKALFYERRFVAPDTQAEVKFGLSLRLKDSTQNSIRDNTLNNHSVLSVCNKNSFKDDISPLMSLNNSIQKLYRHEGNKNGIVEILKDAYSDKRKLKFFELMLNKADLNITSFRPVLEDNVIPSEFKDFIDKLNFTKEVREQILSPTYEDIAFVNSSDVGDFVVSLNLQSQGTRQFIALTEKLYNLINSNCVYRIDEMSEGLHNELLWYFVNVFLYNSDKSQLIIATQETSLLAKDLLNDNRGTVWFVEKNKESASSEYSRGDSFGLHPNLSLYNAYKSGRLGAVPEFGSFFIDLD